MQDRIKAIIKKLVEDNRKGFTTSKGYNYKGEPIAVFTLDIPITRAVTALKKACLEEAKNTLGKKIGSRIEIRKVPMPEFGSSRVEWGISIMYIFNGDIGARISIDLIGNMNVIKIQTGIGTNTPYFKDYHEFAIDTDLDRNTIELSRVDNEDKILIYG